jgi:hypothetical protein
MKRIFVTFLAAIFATALFAQVQNRTEIKPADLPKKVTDYITTTYKDFTIEKVFKLEKNTDVEYRVIVAKGTEKHNVHFDKDGNLIKAPVHVGKPVDKKKEGTPEKKDEAKPKTGAATTPATAPATAPAATPPVKKDAPKK